MIGINYTSFAGDYEHGCRQLKGAVNDAKEVKGALIGGVSTPTLPLTGLA